MKTFVVLAVCTVLVGLSCPMVMAAPSMPADLQIVQPDPSLPKEISAFHGKWENDGRSQSFIIVAKIDEEKASLYLWKTGYWPPEALLGSWERIEAKVIKERGKYKLWWPDRLGTTFSNLSGEYLILSNPWGSLEHRRVP